MLSPVLVRRHPPAFLRMLRSRGLGARAPLTSQRAAAPTRAHVAQQVDAADQGDGARDPALAILRDCQASLREEGFARMTERIPGACGGRVDPWTPCPISAPRSPREGPDPEIEAQGAWLLAHHPAHLLAACIGSESAWLQDGAYIHMALRRGLAVHGPCAQASTWATRACASGLLLGLHLVRGLQRAIADAIILERARGPFAGVRQLKARCRLDNEALCALEASAALDAVAPELNAAQRALLARRAGAEATAYIANATVGGERLLSELAMQERDPVMPPLRAPDADTLRARRFRALGCMVEGHALSPGRLTSHQAGLRDLAGSPPGAAIALVVRCGSRASGASGCIALEDDHGLVASWWEPGLAAGRAQLLRAAAPFAVRGRVLLSGQGYALAIEDALALNGLTSSEPAAADRG